MHLNGLELGKGLIYKSKDFKDFQDHQKSRCRLKIIRQDMFSGNLSDVSSDEGETNDESLFRYVT